MIDTCIPENAMLRDPRRLYAPGRLYHIVERRPFRYFLQLGFHEIVLVLFSAKNLTGNLNGLLPFILLSCTRMLNCIADAADFPQWSKQLCQ